MLDYEKNVRVLCDWNSGKWVIPPPPYAAPKRPWDQEIPKKGIDWLLFHATFSDIVAKSCTGNSRKNFDLLHVPGTHVIGNYMYGSLAYLA